MGDSMENIRDTLKSPKWKLAVWVKTYSKKSTFFFDSHAVGSGSFVNEVVFADRGVFWKVMADLVKKFYIITDLTEMIFSKHTFTPPYQHSFPHIHRWIKFSALIYFIWQSYGRLYGKCPSWVKIAQVKSGRLGQKIFQKEYFFFWFPCSQVWFVRECACFRRSWGILKSYSGFGEIFLYNRRFDLKDILKTYFYPTLSTFFSSHSSVNKIFSPYLLHLAKLWAHIWKMLGVGQNRTSEKWPADSQLIPKRVLFFLIRIHSTPVRSWMCLFSTIAGYFAKLQRI